MPSDRYRTLVVGTGGQGVLTTARLLTRVFSAQGHEVVSGQVHGMAQRGGTVQASIVVGGGPSPVIPRGGADFVLGLEPSETARVLAWMSSRTVTVMNLTPVVPFVVSQQYVRDGASPEYPEPSALAEIVAQRAPQLYVIDAGTLAMAAGSERAVSAVVLGCMAGTGRFPLGPEDLATALVENVAPDVREVNERAYWRGVEEGQC